MADSINLDISKRVDITCRKGDSFQIQLTFTDDSGQAMDVGDHTFKMSVKQTGTSVDDVIAHDSLNYVVVNLNELTVTCPYSVMETVQSGVFVYDLQSKDTSQDFVKTWIYGIFKINEDITP